MALTIDEVHVLARWLLDRGIHTIDDIDRANLLELGCNKKEILFLRGMVQEAKKCVKE